MRNTFLVIKHEILVMLSKPSFWVMTILFPLVIVGLQVGSQLLGSRVIEQESASVTPGNTAVGYVDEAGLIRTIPADIPSNRLVAYPDENAVRVALAAGEISSYYLIPADFVSSGKLVLVSATYNPFTSMIRSDVIMRIVNANLVGDEALAARIANPTVKVEMTPLAPEGGTDTSNPLAFLVPFATLFIFYFVILMSASFMLQSVAKEKENRTIEVLLVGLRPRDMMMGKVIGLGVVALLQIAIWVGVGMMALDRGTAALATTASAFSLPPGFVIWALLYFLLGYLLYASLMGALGALAPSSREGQQFVIIIIAPLMIPLFVINAFVQSPNGTLATVLSMFPLTAPVAMITRLVATGVPFWQPVVSLVLLAATVYGVVWAAARLFRAQTLLSGATLTPKRIWQALRER